MDEFVFKNATLVLPDRLLPNAGLRVRQGRIEPFGEGLQPQGRSQKVIDLRGQYLAPGFIDLHVHGGDGADVMDGTVEAFRTVCRCHARHGTIALTPTSSVARFDQYERFLKLCEELINADTGGARVLGGHLYGPYFSRAAKGCHPDADFLSPELERDERLVKYAGNGLTTLTVAPELPGAERLIKAARERGLLVTAGHTHATFPQMEAAVDWGVRHVDHLYCAMSDRARLRQSQTYPMRAGVFEATLYFDELTTEVIADGKHLTADLLKLAYKVKGPDRLALVTDAMRAVDCPDGEYWFGPTDGGELVWKHDGVGLTRDGTALASGVMGMDHCVRSFHHLTGVALPEVVRMASLTPARILGIDRECGSLESGKRADLVVLNKELQVQQVFIEGRRVV